MKKLDLGEAVGILANVGVIAGIIFLGFELRQNTSAVQAATSQGLTEFSASWLSALSTDPELAGIWLKALDDSSQLQGDEALRAAFYQRGQWIRMQNAFNLWRRGSLSDADWAVNEALICRQPSESISGRSAKYRIETWDNHREALTEEFAAFVEECWSSAAH